MRWWSPGLAWPGLVPPCSGARRLGRHDRVGHLLPGEFLSFPSTSSSSPLLRLAWPWPACPRRGSGRASCCSVAPSLLCGVCCCCLCYCHESVQDFLFSVPAYACHSCLILALCLCSCYYACQTLKCVHLYCPGLMTVCHSCNFASARAIVCYFLCSNSWLCSIEHYCWLISVIQWWIDMCFACVIWSSGSSSIWCATGYNHKSFMWLYVNSVMTWLDFFSIWLFPVAVLGWGNL